MNIFDFFVFLTDHQLESALILIGIGVMFYLKSLWEGPGEGER